MINQTQIIELEERYWQAMREEDIETAVSLSRFPCLISSQKGSRLILEDDFRKMMAGHSGNMFQGIELKNKLVEVLNEDTAVITYEYEMQGKTFLDASTWVNEKGNWVCGFHSETQKIQ